MKILPILLMAASLPVCATGWGQNVSLRVEQAHPREVIKQLEKQTGYRFIYGSHLMEGSKPITIQADNQPLEKVLLQCFKEQPFGFEIDPPFVVLTKKHEVPKKEVQTIVNKIDIDIRGRVLDGEGQPIAGATVLVKGTSIATSTDDQGFFSLKEIAPNTILVITGAEMEDMEVSVGDKTFLNVQVTRKENTLDETIVIAYGKTSRRLNTGSVSKVTAAEISRQPVSNPILAIAGRVPGLMITPANGLPGANTAILLRGEQSLGQGIAPLILVDGIPLTLNTDRLAEVNSTANQNLLNTINPADIESIEVLKDAEATAIYGSQGANGVILISTKGGRGGQTTFELNTYTGFKNITRSVKLLNTEEYLTMREEAFANDGVTPTINNAPDLVEWDNKRYTNWINELIGGTGLTNNIQLSLSGGSATTNFLVSGSWYNERSIYPDDYPARRGTGRANFAHKSHNQKFQFRAGLSYTYDHRKSPLADLTKYIFLPPNAPPMKNQSGELLWTPGVDNPYAYQKQRFNGVTTSMITNAEIIYALSDRISLKLNGGYNQTEMRETGYLPISSREPGPNVTGSSMRSAGLLRSWIVEPQINGKWAWQRHTLQLIGGASFQRRYQDGLTIAGFEYANDDFIENIAAAGRVEIANRTTQYRYQAAFARLTWNWKQRYLFSANWRRDGSSRFGPAEQYANFSALSAGWIFSEESWLNRNNSIVSFGKLRASYGVTGNDQIGDYQFIDGWSTNPNFSYGYGLGFLPERLFNPELRWERTKKLQIGVELGFWNNALQLTIDHYRNRSDNQLVNYSLPGSTGFNNILRNLDALIENRGWEFLLNYRIVSASILRWEMMATISIPRNELLKYPGLDISSDASRYEIGKPLQVLKRYQWIGVDPTTGLNQFADLDGDGSVQPGTDYAVAGYKGPRYFGGISNKLRYKNWELSAFVQFIRQFGFSHVASLVDMPGTMINQPIAVLDRWQVNKTDGRFQRFSQGAFEPYLSHLNYVNSNAVLVNTSFARLKNIMLSYQFSSQNFKRLGIRNARIYIQAQDIFTFTNYRGADPETQSVRSLPPLKTIVGGIQITF
jgi:TonB-linked SusC/RagA family outer membrane protein